MKLVTFEFLLFFLTGKMPEFTSKIYHEYSYQNFEIKCHVHISATCFEKLTLFVLGE